MQRKGVAKRAPGPGGVATPGVAVENNCFQNSHDDQIISRRQARGATGAIGSHIRIPEANDI